MGTVLILTGIVCVIAAIVGGGVKLHNVEVGNIASLWRQILLAVVGSLLALWGVAEKNSGANSAYDPGFSANQTDANLVENSVDMNASTDANLVMDDDTGDVGVGDADVPAPVETEDRSLWVKNDCSQPLQLYVATYNNGSWDTHGDTSWTIKPGGTYISENNQRVRTGTTDIYFRAHTENGGNTWEGNYSVGSLAGLRKHQLTLDPDGDYRLALVCD